MIDLKELEKEWPIRPWGSLACLPSSDANPNFFEVSMAHILDPSRPARERDVPLHQGDASSSDSVMLADLFRKDGACLSMTVPKIDGRIAADLVQAFLGDGMFQVSPRTRVLPACLPVDFGKGIDALASLCRRQLDEHPFSGTVMDMKQTMLRRVQPPGLAA